MQTKRTIVHLTASAALLSALALSTGAHVHAAATAPYLAAVPAQSASTQETAAYLQQQFGIKLSGTITKPQFEKGLLKVRASSAILSSEEGEAAFFQGADKSGSLQVWEAVSAAVKAAELKELAYTYTDEQIAAAWKTAGWSYTPEGSIAKEAAQEIAAALDTGFLTVPHAGGYKLDAALTAELGYQLLGKVAEFLGEQQHFLGYISEPDIYGKLVQAWNESVLIKSEELQKTVDEALKQNLITGYNLKDTQYDPHFDPARTITYGHSDIIHAVQLIGLLKREGIEAKVQLEPKTSAFVYLKEWGEPVETDNYQVASIENGNHIAYAKEYDLSLEFASVKEKEQFQPLVLKYAKKNEENAAGLLKSSWWQPLYYSLTELEDYPVITNHVLKNGRYLAQSFTLNEESAKVIAGLKKVNPAITVESYQFWVDQPFHNYLKGDYK